MRGKRDTFCIKLRECQNLEFWNISPSISICWALCWALFTTGQKLKEKWARQTSPNPLFSIWSGREDLNLRPLAPHASTLPGCATPRKRKIIPKKGAQRCRISRIFFTSCLKSIPSILSGPAASACCRCATASVSRRCLAPLMVNPCS